jgi:hypothetical protein
MITQELTPIGDGFDERCEPLGAGAFVKFDANTETKWFYRDGRPLPKRQYVAVDCRIELIRWHGKRKIDGIVQRPGEPLPDPDELNAEIPKSEWEEDFNGNPRGPWQRQYSIFFVDPIDGSRLICGNSTWGQQLAFDELKGRIQSMRQIRGQRVFPLIEFASTLFPTRFGMKPRPCFEVKEWRAFGSSTAVIGPPGKPEPELSSDEIADDEIPFGD